MADNITLEDKDGVPKITRTKEDSSAVHTPVMLLADQEVKSGNGYALGSSTSRSITVTTTEDSFEVTSAALFTAADVGSAIEGTGIPANAIITTFTDTSTVTFSTPPTTSFPHGTPATASGSPSATIRSGFAGTFEESRSKGVVRQLHVIALVLSDGVTFPADLGGTFVFQYSENGSTPTISETRAITDFASVRDFDLVNAGAYFRVMFAPDRDIVSGDELIIGTTTFRHHFDGQFVRLANQQIEEANAAMGQLFAFLKGFNPATGKSENIRAIPLDVLLSGDEAAIVSRSVTTGMNPDGDLLSIPVTGIDSDWTSTTPLANGASWDGPGSEMISHALAGWVGSVIFVKADQTGELEIQHSESGVIDDDDNRTVTLSYDPAVAAQGVPYHIPAWSKYVYFKFTNNSGSDQTQFTFTVMHTQSRMQPAALPIGTGVSNATLSEVVKAIIEAENDSGQFGPIERADGGGLRISVNEHETDTPIRACDGWQTTRATASTTTVVLLSSGAALANRVTVEIFNTSGNRELRIGPTVARVDAGQYRTVAAGDHIIMELGPGVDIAGRSDSATLTVEFVELADSSV